MPGQFLGLREKVKGLFAQLSNGVPLPGRFHPSRRAKWNLYYENRGVSGRVGTGR